ncbi:MAG TPA: hypothetical protein EYP68_04495 [Candidatus Korarchaeota archaeon]|nr:hypothetical protein [Candidatus Korarchaeota archaeon]
MTNKGNMILRLSLVAALVLAILPVSPFQNLIGREPTPFENISNLSQESLECISCHSEVTPGIVEDWANSKHAKVIVNDVWIACYECHKAAPNRPDAVNHYAGRIVSVVTPKDCSTCHQKEFEEFMKSKHAFAVINGPLKPWYQHVKKLGLDPYSQEAIKEVDPYEFISKLVTPLFPESGC